MMSICCPSEYRIPTRFQEFPNEQYVLAVDADGAKTQAEFEDKIQRQSDIDTFVLKYPKSKIFPFEQVINDNLNPFLNQTRRSASGKSRSRSRQGLKSSSSGTNPGENGSKSARFKDSVIKEKINEVLYSSMIHFQNQEGSKDSSSLEGQVKPDLQNFCYVQLSSYPQVQPVFPLSLNQLAQTSRNFGSFLSLRQIDDGNNMAVKGLLEILQFQKDHMNVLGNGIKYGISFKPKVRVQIALFHNNEIYDMLAEKRIQKLRLEQQVNEVFGSQTIGQTYQNLTGASQINVHSLADIKTVVRAAQHSKATLCEDLKIDVSELTMRTTVLVRAQIEDQNCFGTQTFDFVELPASNIMSSPKILAFSGESREAQKVNKKYVIEAYKAVSAAMVLLQTTSKGSKIDGKKSQRLASSIVTQALEETLFFSNPCLAVMCCYATPEQTSYPQTLTALSYTSQIREHVLRKQRRGQLNRDLAGQTMETIAQELSMMQEKLDKEYASLASLVDQDDKEENVSILMGNHDIDESKEISERNKDQNEQQQKQKRDMVLYAKLSELVKIYQNRVKELQSQHTDTEQSHREFPKKLEDEIKNLREELTQIQSELGLEPDLFNFCIGDMNHKKEEDCEEEDQILSQLAAPKSNYGDEPDLLLQEEIAENQMQLPREFSSKNQVQFQLDDNHVNSQPTTSKNNLYTDYSLVLDTGIQNKLLLNEQAPHYFPIRSGKTLQSNNSRSQSPEQSGDSLNGMIRRNFRKPNGITSMHNSGSFSSSKIPAHIRAQNSTLNLDQGRVCRSLTKSQKSVNSKKSRGSKQSKSRLSADTISSKKKKSLKFRESRIIHKIKSVSSKRSKNSSVSQKRPHSRFSKQKRSKNRSIASRSNNLDQSLLRGIVNNSSQMPFINYEQDPNYENVVMHQNSSKRVDFSLELSGTEKSPSILGNTSQYEGNLAQFGTNNLGPSHIIQTYVNPYTDHTGSSLDLRPLPSTGQDNFSPQSEGTMNPMDGVASRSHNLGSVDISIMSSNVGEVNGPTPSSLANKSKQLLKKYREAKQASKQWGSQMPKSDFGDSYIGIPQDQQSKQGFQDNVNSFQESFLQSQQLHSQQNQSLIDQATAQISEKYEQHIHGLLAQMVTRDQENQELQLLLRQAENRNGQIEIDMYGELSKIKELITPRSNYKEEQAQVKSINEKMVDLLQYKIQSKKQISELTFKTERLQRINRKITEENEQIVGRIQLQEKTLSDQTTQIEGLTRQLDVSVYENVKPKLKSMKKVFKRRASSKSNSKTRNTSQVVPVRSSSRISQNSKKSQNSRCLSASKKSILSQSSKMRGTFGSGNSQTSAKKRSVSIGVRSGNSSKKQSKSIDEKMKLRENIQELENELLQLKQAYSHDNESLRRQAQKIKANLDLTMMQKKGLEGEVKLIRSTHQELQTNKQRIEQESEAEKSRFIELEQAYNHLQEMYDEQCVNIQQSSQRFRGLDDKVKALEEAKKLYRSQYLELREANKDLKMQCKATKKTINAQKEIYHSQTRYRGLSMDKENEDSNDIGEAGGKIQARILQDILKERDAGHFAEIRNLEI